MATATASPSDPALPTPADRPEADVVIYDGNCGICTAQVRKLPWWDCQNKLSYFRCTTRKWPAAGPTFRTIG